MKTLSTRRAFLADVGRGVLATTLGVEVASGLGLLSAAAGEVREVAGGGLEFGAWESWVRLMQETPADQLLPKLVAEIRAGVDLRQLVGAGALANARTFGGEDYVGFHTVMALAPAYYMAQELPAETRALPVLKVLYRNTSRIQEHGGRRGEVLREVAGGLVSEGIDAGESLREAVHRRDLAAAERTFAAAIRRSPEEALNQLLMTVQESPEVHRVVLPYRAWDLVGIIGQEHAHTLLRQSVHYCVQAEGWTRSPALEEARAILPRLLEEHHLMGRSPGDRAVDDAWIESTSQALFRSTPAQAAGVAAAALAEGIAPAAVGEAVTLAANQLILRDHGRTPRDEVPGKPIGSVHGDSIGVHACDSANAWRNLARVGRGRNVFASLILGAYQVALDRTARGGDFLEWQPLPVPRHLDEVRTTEPAKMLAEADEAIRGNLQGKASAVVQRYGQLGHPARPMFDLLLRYAVSEDGSLHGEKFYRTVTEEFAATRPAFRWRHVVALARVTASEFGRPGAGMAQARELLRSA